MKALSLTFGVSVLACNTGGPCAQASFGAPSFAAPSFGSSFNQIAPFQPAGNGFGYPSGPSNWQNSPSSLWTPLKTPARPPSVPRPPNPSLAGRSPSEQLQITKCRSAQSCTKCRQLNCYWDSTARITNRCIALGLESTQIPVEAGQASNLGSCPSSGQTGYLGVNWLAIENSGAAVPNLEGMSDAAVQQWLSSLPNYDPDETESNYPAGTAFKELLPTAAKAYADGKIPSTTPWISFFDSLQDGYHYDGYHYDNSYNYDSGFYDSSYPSFPGWSSNTPSFSSLAGPSFPSGPASFSGPSFPFSSGPSFSNTPFPDASFSGTFSGSFSGAPFASSSLPSSPFSSPAFPASTPVFTGGTAFPASSAFPAFPASSAFPASTPAFPSFGGLSSVTSGFSSQVGFPSSSLGVPPW